MVLENYFVHGSRSIEQKDGNALNEVRMLSNSMMNDNNILTADNTIKYKPENSIVKYQPGDEIKLKQEDFLKLSKVFFAEIESKYL